MCYKFSYDNDGNVTTGLNGLKATWDWRNRLVTASSTNFDTYSYDENNQRVRIQTPTTVFHYPNQYYATDNISNIPTKHVFLNGAPLAEVIGPTGSSTVTYDFTDDLGYVAASADTNNRVQEVTDYKPFGAINTHDDLAGFNEIRKYIGQQYDNDTALSYLNARYYDGNQGQFISQDPMFLANPSQEDIQDPQSLNSYSYSEDNPILKSDPNGRNAFTAGAQGTFWGGTGSLGINVDQYGLDYYYSWGVAEGAEGGLNAGMTTDNLSHTYSLSSSGFVEEGEGFGGGASVNDTEYPYSKKPNDYSVSMYGGVGFGEAAGERTVVSGPIITWGSSQEPAPYTGPETISAPSSNDSWYLPSYVVSGGSTYYRNSSGLLSTTMSISTPAVAQGSSAGGNPTGASPGSAGSLLQLHAIVPH